MNWDAIGAIGELIGATAVVTTLVYLGRQIHQANTRSQADATYSFLNAYGPMNLAVAENKELASIFRRGLQGLELDEDEAIQFFAFAGHYVNTWSVFCDLHAKRQFPDTQWTVIRKDIITFISTPGGRKFWDDVGQLGVHDHFRKEVEKILVSDETSFKIV